VNVLALLAQPEVAFAPDPVMPSAPALLVVTIVIGLLALAAWVLRRNAPSRRTRQAVTVETAVSLGDRRSLVIVGVEGRRLLLGLTPGSISLVTELGTSFTDTLRASIDGSSSTPARPE
jgi:flagellar biosynthetic protein FliO